MIAILGDTHLPRGGRRLPDSCLRVLAGADAVLHVGDFTETSVLEALRELAPVHAVHGNMDEPALVRDLPERLVAEVAGLRVGLVHDAGPREGRHERLRGWFPGCGVIVYGHTHEPEIARAADAWIVNPGSPTERRRAPRHTMATVADGPPELVYL